MGGGVWGGGGPQGGGGHFNKKTFSHFKHISLSLQSGYNKETARIPQGYGKDTARIQPGYSQDSAGRVAVIRALLIMDDEIQITRPRITGPAMTRPRLRSPDYEHVHERKLSRHSSASPS